MAEARYPVQVYRTDYLCDQCQTPVQYTGRSKEARMLALPGNGTLYQHCCPQCGVTLWLEYEYPVTGYEAIPDFDLEGGLERLRRAVVGVDG